MRAKLKIFTEPRHNAKLQYLLMQDEQIIKDGYAINDKNWCQTLANESKHIWKCWKELTVASANDFMRKEMKQMKARWQKRY